MPASLPLIDVSGPLCCPPLGAPSPSPEHDAEQIAARLRALGDAGRVRIVGALACCEGHEMTTGDAAALLGVTDATASHHLRQLLDAGLVLSRRDGRRSFYRLDLEATRAIATALTVTCGASCACC
jgi:DNA-binding transcriptional ArsR family regulator